MGGWLSKSWSSWGNEQYLKQQQQQAAEFRHVIAQGFFNLNLAPTRDEFDSDDSWSSSLYLDAEEDEADGYLAWGRGVGRDIRNRVYDESRCALENRRPGFWENTFGW
jgi:hypothetical protein